MEYVITKIARQKMAAARNNTGTIARVKYIALGTGGTESDGSIRCPLAQDVGLKNEIIRKEFTSTATSSDTSYEYTIRLSESECVGESISEIALIDEDGDTVAIACFLPKGKDDAPVEYSIEDTY